MFKLLTIPFVFLILTIWTTETHGVVFYDYEDFQGRYFVAPQGWKTKICNNVDSWIVNLTSSIDTEDECVVVYDEANCLGLSMSIFPRSCCHHNLERIEFGDKIRSYHLCPRTLNDALFSPLPNNDTNNATKSIVPT